MAADLDVVSLARAAIAGIALGKLPPFPGNEPDPATEFWRAFARQHQQALLDGRRWFIKDPADPAADPFGVPRRPKASFTLGPFARIVAVCKPTEIELDDPGMGVESFVLNGTDAPSIPIHAPNLGLRAVRAFSPTGEAVGDELIDLANATELRVPVGGFVRF
jgi:hypothetical protein